MEDAVDALFAFGMHHYIMRNEIGSMQRISAPRGVTIDGVYSTIASHTDYLCYWVARSDPPKQDQTV